jgi:hypothetical protein
LLSSWLLCLLPPQTRLAAPGGVSAQTITNSPITIYNRDPEEINRLAQQIDRSKEDQKAAEAKAADLAHQLDLSNVTAQTVMGFLRVLARQPDLKLDQVPVKMAEITANYMQMQGRLAALSPQDPAAANLAKQAVDAGRAGRFEEADHLLEQAEAREIECCRRTPQEGRGTSCGAWRQCSDTAPLR